LTIINDLLSTSERESGGRTAIDRFDFQTAWGIANVLRLHDTGINYAVAFEFHDDIVELDDADAPKAAIFYQLKTLQSGHLTFTEILAREASGKGAKKTLKASYMGKMFDNIVKFSSAVVKLVLVSNQPLSGLTNDYGETPISSAETDHIEKVRKALAKECSTFDEKHHLKFFFFDRSRLELGDYENALLGRVTKFLDHHSAPVAAAPAFTIYLTSEGKRRSKSLSEIADFDTLKSSKFLTRRNMGEWLEKLNRDFAQHPSWEAVSRQLNAGHSEDKKIEREWRYYQSERIRRWNTATADFTSKVKVEIEPIIDAADNLAEGLLQAIPIAEDAIRRWKPDASDYLIKAIILYEYRK